MVDRVPRVFFFMGVWMDGGTLHVYSGGGGGGGGGVVLLRIVSTFPFHFT